MAIDCSCIDRIDLLKKLWYSSKETDLSLYFQSFGIPPCSLPPMKGLIGLEEQSKRYIDIMAGRYIKIDFTKYPYIDPTNYNMCNGDKLFEYIILYMKE